MAKAKKITKAKNPPRPTNATKLSREPGAPDGYRFKEERYTRKDLRAGKVDFPTIERKRKARALGQPDADR